MSKPWNPNKQTVELAPSRIRRAPPKPEQTILRRTEEQELWFGVAGVIVIAAVVGALIVGIGVVTIVRAVAAPDRSFNQCYNAGASDCVVDGDTLKVAGGMVDIAGIAVPRIQGAACRAERERGILAAVTLSELLKSGNVEIPASGRDAFGREGSAVLLDGAPVAERMIAAGHARRDEGQTQDWCAE